MMPRCTDTVLQACDGPTPYYTLHIGFSLNLSPVWVSKVTGNFYEGLHHSNIICEDWSHEWNASKCYYPFVYVIQVLGSLFQQANICTVYDFHQLMKGYRLARIPMNSA